MNVFRLFILLLFLFNSLKAESELPRLSAKGKDYHISIYSNSAVIKRLTDGEKKKISGLLWGDSKLQKKQPVKFFDNESNTLLFLMNTYHYALIDIDELFENGEEYDFEKIEGGVFKSQYMLDRTNISWSLNGIYPNKMIKGKATNAVGELEFTLDLNKRWVVLTTTNRKAAQIISLRMVIDEGETPFRYEFK